MIEAYANQILYRNTPDADRAYPPRYTYVPNPREVLQAVCFGA